MKAKLFHITFIALAFAATVLAILGGAYFRAGLDLAVGMYSPERIRAPFAFHDDRATERNRQAAQENAENLELRYTIDEGEWRFVENNLLILHGDIVRIREAYTQERTAHDQALEEWDAEVDLQNRQIIQEWQNWDEMFSAIVEAGGDTSTLPPRPEASEPPPMPQWQNAYRDMFIPLHM